ncbi:MAG: hypothetical protein IKN42_00485 [Elusimicrobia bacterium]|nr:hypothetical protein [Elusimicrobiota bacterium]
MVDFYDFEYDKVFTIDSYNKNMMNKYYKKMAEFNSDKLEIFKKSNVDVINIINGVPYLPELIKFFNNRHKRRVLG